jgi:hypothetical protein
MSGIQLNGVGDSLQPNTFSELSGDYVLGAEEKNKYTTQRLKDFCLELLEEHEVLAGFVSSPPPPPLLPFCCPSHKNKMSHSKIYVSHSFHSVPLLLLFFLFFSL